MTVEIRRILPLSKETASPVEPVCELVGNLAALSGVKLAVFSSRGEPVTQFPARFIAECPCSQESGCVASLNLMVSGLARADAVTSGSSCEKSSFFVAPVADRGRTAGFVMGCGLRTQREAFAWGEFIRHEAARTLGATYAESTLKNTVRELLECYEELDLLHDLEEKLRGKLERADVSRIVVEAVHSRLAVRMAALYTALSGEGPLELDAQAGWLGHEEGSIAKRLHAAAAKALAEGRPVLENLPRRKGGSLLAVPITTRAGKTTVVVVADRVTGEPFTSQDRKLLESLVGHVALVLEDVWYCEQLKEFNQDLQRRVEQATAELKDANRELVRAQDRLIKAERTALVGQLAVTLNHEINNPLSVIMATCQLIESDIPSMSAQSLHENLKRIQSSARIIGGRVARLRDVGEPLVKEYIDGVKMIDVDSSLAKDGPSMTGVGEEARVGGEKR